MRKSIGRNLCAGTPAGCSYLPSLRGDDLSPSCTIPGHEYSLDEIISALGKMGVIWEIGAELMEEALASCPDDRKELGNAIVCGCLWRSAENAYRAYRLRKEWSDEKVHEMRRIILAELETLHKALPRSKKTRDSVITVKLSPVFSMRSLFT